MARKGRNCLGVLLAGAIFLAGCARLGAHERQEREAFPSGPMALLPFENLTEVRGASQLIERLVKEAVLGRGYEPIESTRLEDFLRRKRVRRTGEIDVPLAQALRKELGAAVILVGTIESFTITEPPRVGLFARLLSAADGSLLWAESAGFSGEDFHIALNLGKIRDPRILAGRTVKALLSSLPRPGERGREPGRGRGWNLFSPLSYYQRATGTFGPFDFIAVLPFDNETRVKKATSIVHHLFIEELFRRGRFRVIAPGEVNRILRKYRIVARGELSHEALRTLGKAMRVVGIIIGSIIL
ncbi:MAG: hypothetical protein ACE5LX_03380, partial [Nitrospinota bacterium]